jgi:hypothetical protein
MDTNLGFDYKEYAHKNNLQGLLSIEKRVRL